MAEEGYRARISRDEARKAMVGLLPNVSLDVARNYDSNRFLVNNNWTSVGLQRRAQPRQGVLDPGACNRSEEAQKRADDARRQAMAMAVLAQTRIAAVRYTLVADEFMVWDEAARDDDLIVQHLASSESGRHRQRAGADPRARARAGEPHQPRPGLRQRAGERSRASTTRWATTPCRARTRSKAVAELANAVAGALRRVERASFSHARGSSRSRPWRVGQVSRRRSRASPRWCGRALDRVLDDGRLDWSDGGADVRLDLRLQAGCARRKGVRTVRVAVERAAARQLDGDPALREFRTTLSEPVDDEQWRALGEGAAYRVDRRPRATRASRARRCASSAWSSRMPRSAAAGRRAAPLQPARATPLDLRALDRDAIAGPPMRRLLLAACFVACDVPVPRRRRRRRAAEPEPAPAEAPSRAESRRQAGRPERRDRGADPGRRRNARCPARWRAASARSRSAWATRSRKARR